MQSHIDKAYEFLDQFLPYEYVVEVELILQKKKIKVSGGTIRNIRTKRVPNPRIDVLNALLLVAKKNQKQLLELESNLKK